MIHLTAEEQIVLLTAQSSPARGATDSAGDIVRNAGENLKYDRLLHLASRNGVAPFLYRALKETDCVPADILGMLEKSYLAALARNVAQLAETQEILGELKVRGIDAIPLKGALASEMLFHDPGLYASGDIDILVRPRDLDAVKNILTDRGYHYDRKKEADLLATHYHLAFYTEHHAVEVHWKLSKRYFAIPPDFWWEGTSTMTLGGSEILCLSPERYLMYLILRLFSHNFFPLKFFVLTSELMKKYHDTINGQAFIGGITKYGMRTLTAFTFSLMKDLFGTEAPESLAMARGRKYNLLKSFVINNVFRNLKRPYIGKLLFLSLLDTETDVVRAVARRVFPGREELRLRYKVPEKSKLIYVYYLANPLLLPALILRKRFYH